MQFIRSNWFLLALAFAFGLGHFVPSILRPIAEQPLVRSILVMLVMWAMGITLKADAIRRSVKRPTASLLAIGINVLLVPALSVAAMPFLSRDMGGGLFVAGLVPCTLASASVWTRKAGGDDSIAIVTTTVTNLATLVVVPVGLFCVFLVQSKVSPIDQMQKLALFVVLPLVIAQSMRRFGWAVWADANKPRLSLGAQIGILVMVSFGAVIGWSYGGSNSVKSSMTQLGLVVAAAIAVHLLAFGSGVFLSRRFGVAREGQIAVGIAGSQKTLMVGLQIAIDCGVSVVPMMVYHVCQLFVDTLIVQRWRRAGEGGEDEGS